MHVLIKAKYNMGSLCYIKVTQVNEDRDTEKMMIGTINRVKIDWEVEKWAGLQI